MSSTIAPTTNDPITPPPSGGGFQSFENAAADAILTISYNSSGKRLATASADHKVRIYDSVDQENEPKLNLIDQWRAHDAEILDIQWIPGPYPGHFATTASDNKLKIWGEDPSQAPLSGRRFRCIFSQSPFSHVTYSSFSFHARNNEIYLALFAQDGLFSLLEPTQPASIAMWREIDHFYPFGRHARGTEPKFCVSFHQSPYPSTQALTANLPPSTLSLAVSAGGYLKIYRALPISSSTSSSPSLAPFSPQHQHQYPDNTTTTINNNTTSINNTYNQLSEYLELSLSPANSSIGSGKTVINHLAWAPGCLSPSDVLAAACDDGTVRIIDILVSPSGREAGILKGPRAGGSARTSSPPGGSWERHHGGAGSFSGRGGAATTPSGIGAGLAGLTTKTTRGRREGAAEFRHEGQESAVLSHDGRDERERGRGRGRPCWKVRWVYDGSAVASVGDEGDVVLWRRSVDEGKWLEWSRTRYES